MLVRILSSPLAVLLFYRTIIVPQKSISGKDLDEAVTSDDILGKDIIDVDGKLIGVTEKVFIHPNSLDFIGIEVDKGFLRKGFSIGKDYI